MNNYQINLGRTYYNKGYFNVGVIASHNLGQHGENLILVLNEVELNITINRNANNNGSVRLYGGNQLTHFIQNNYNLGNILEFQIVNPNQINII